MSSRSTSRASRSSRAPRPGRLRTLVALVIVPAASAQLPSPSYEWLARVPVAGDFLMLPPQRLGAPERQVRVNTVVLLSATVVDDESPRSDATVYATEVDELPVLAALPSKAPKRRRARGQG